MGMDSLSFWGCRNGRNGMKEDVLQTKRRRKFWDPHVFRELCRKSLLKLQDCDPSVILRERERDQQPQKRNSSYAALPLHLADALQRYCSLSDLVFTTRDPTT